MKTKIINNKQVAVTLFVLYVAYAIHYGMTYRGWDAISTFYFVIVTFTTVGYLNGIVVNETESNNIVC